MDEALWGTCEESLGLAGMSLLVLWIFLPGFLVNTFAMMWGKWLPKTGYGPWPIDGGRTAWDGNRLLGDGKTWNGLVGGSLTSGLLMVVMASAVNAGESIHCSTTMLRCLAGSGPSSSEVCSASSPFLAT